MLNVNIIKSAPMRIIGLSHTGSYIYQLVNCVRAEKPSINVEKY
ncbi:Uncharacterised protein [Serratia fonticola]|nr:Uncharacterised protein [Serratia fonticola]